jgi:hypothetical protein
MAASALVVAAMMVGANASADDVAPWPAGAKVEILSPKEGATAEGTVKVSMKVTGMKVVPTGKAKAGEGHFIIAIDKRAWEAGHIPYLENGADLKNGESEATVDIGYRLNHTILVQFVDGENRSYGPQASAVVHVKAPQ